jgi:hypothetical protein
MSTTIAITLSDDVSTLIENGLPIFNQNEATTHGALTIEKLAAMLLEDVGHAVRRPGSWEGSNMARVIRCHGYRVA